MTSSTPYLGKSSDDLVPISDRRSNNANNKSAKNRHTSEDTFNLATSSTSRHLINGSSPEHILPASPSTSSLDASSSSGVRRRLESTHVQQSQSSHSSISNNLRHSILTQSSSGPKYESSNAPNSQAGSSSIFFDDDLRDSETADQFDSSSNKDNSNNGESSLPIDHSNLDTSEGSNLDGDVSLGTSSGSFVNHHKHRVEINDQNGQANNSPLSSIVPDVDSSSSSSSTSSSSLPNSFHHSRPHPFIPSVNSQSKSSKSPLILVSVSTSDSNDQSNVDTRKIHIHDLVPRRRPPKRLELPTVPTSSSSSSSLSPTPIAFSSSSSSSSYSTSMSARISSSISAPRGPSGRQKVHQQPPLPLAFFNPPESNSTQRSTFNSLSSVRSATNGRSGNLLAQLSIPTAASSSSLSSTTSTTTTTARPVPSSHLFPEDGRPFGLLDYETLLGDSDANAPGDFDGQAPPSEVNSSGQINNRTPSINPSNNSLLFPSSHSNSFDSTSVNSGESVSPRIIELPSDSSRTQLIGSIANPSSAPASTATTVTASTEKCNLSNCKLPKCNCGSAKIPNGLKVKDVPQIILLTFDDAVNDLNWDIYEQIFNSGRKNPNGCPILGTFYVSHEWTDYSQVQTLYSRGHEIASHGISHSFGEKFTKNQWMKEIDGQRQILHLYAGVKLEDVRGMRAPFLQIGGNKQFEMLHEANFTYDSSMPIFENDPPFYPYTLDHSISHECMITPCPSKSFPGLWEVGLVMYQDLQGGRCSMADACQNPPDAETVFKMLLKNFNRHYKSNRAPFGLFYHSAWFNTQHHFKGFLKFIDHILTKSDVYFTTNWQMIQWMKKPTSLSTLKSFAPWSCSSGHRPIGECLNPHVCTVKHKEGSRFMKTCQTCPIYYPWVGRIA